MRSRIFLALLLTCLQSISIRSQEVGPFIITLPIQTEDESNDAENPVTSRLSSIAAQLNCTSPLDIRHKGVKTEEVLRDSIFHPTTTTTTTTSTERTKHAYPEYGDEENSSNSENESTEKTTDGDKPPRYKRSPDDTNPSTNVTIHHNYSIVKKYPIAQNHSKSDEKQNTTECLIPFYDDGDEYHWYQIIFENGGVPGEVFNVTRLKPNATKVMNPCQRPITETVPAMEDLIYKYERIEFERVYRREEAYLRFAGTPSEFVDVHGHFVWSPPGYHRRYYRLEYHKDDTGFYVQVHQGQKCVFSENPVSIKCNGSRGLKCFCDEKGKESCFELRVFSPALAASLVGG